MLCVPRGDPRQEPRPGPRHCCSRPRRHVKAQAWRVDSIRVTGLWLPYTGGSGLSGHLSPAPHGTSGRPWALAGPLGLASALALGPFRASRHRLHLTLCSSTFERSVTLHVHVKLHYRLTLIASSQAAPPASFVRAVLGAVVAFVSRPLRAGVPARCGGPWARLGAWAPSLVCGGFARKSFFRYAI